MADETPEIKDESTTAHGRYEHLRTIREPYLRRAREVAEVTIPALMPPEGSTGQTDLPTPYQSIGARGVSNLASKILLALLPPGQSYMKLSVDDFVLQELAQQAGVEEQEDARAKFETALGKVVRAVEGRVEKVGIRTKVFEGVKQLVASGNVLFEVLDDTSLRIHRLKDYVVKRDGEGNVLEIIVLEKLSRTSAPQKVRELIEDNPKLKQQDDSAEDTIDLYTRIVREDSKWQVHQEVGDGGEVVPDSEGTYPLDKSPWQPVRWTAVDGEDYGRGHAEEYLGDLKSLDSVYKSLVEYASVASRILYFVEPGGVTDPTEVAEAPSGEVLDGDAKDVTVLQLEKYNDFKIAWETGQQIEQRLEKAFLLMSGVQRHAERVTAEEVRRLADELEQALGGVYSILSEELLRPLLETVMHRMEMKDELPSLPKDSVNFEIVTGLEALGRNRDLLKLDLLIQGIQNAFGPEAVHQHLNVGSYIKRRAAALGIDAEGMVRSEEEVQQMRQQAQMAQMAEKAMGPGLQFIGDRAKAAEEQQKGEEAA